MRKTSLLLVFALVIFSTSLYSQKKDIKYNSLLWEVTGNGLNKPCYLFGTMHVSQKLAFHLGEPFFNGIQSVDVVATEMNPETWLQDMLDADIVNASMGMISRSGRYRDIFGDKYEDMRYAIGKQRAEQIAEAFQQEPDLINSIMYRMQYYGSDLQEDSWLDMYIYQTARKMGKVATGLESFEEGMDAIQKASVAEQEESDKKSFRSLFGKGNDMYAQLENAYRSGNLDLLDSLNNKMSSKATRKYILIERNKLFIQRMDSIMKTQTIFTAVGAAHLPGDSGMIAMLRAKGYTVKAIKMGERDAARRDELDSKLFEPEFKRYYTSDSVFSVEVPAKLNEFYSTGVTKSDVATELANGAFYTLNRIKTYSNLVDGDIDATWKMVDSLLYDNIPGKIEQQKQLTYKGYKTIDVTSKTRKGHTVRIRIVLLPEELLIMKVSAPEDKVKSFLGDRFFNSLEINMGEQNGWQQYTLPDNSLSLQLPERPLYYGDSKVAKLIGNNSIVAHDAKTKSEYLAMIVALEEREYFEEDTFELSLAARGFAKANNFTEQTRELVTFKSRRALRIGYSTANDKKIESLFVLSGNKAYIFGVFYGKQKPDFDKYFNSVVFNNPKIDKLYPKEDTIINAKVVVPEKPKKNVLEGLMNRYARYLDNEKNKGEVYYTTQVFGDKNGKEEISVSLFKYSKYFTPKSEEQFKKNARMYATDFNDLAMKDEQFKKLPDGMQMDFYLVDTNSSKMQRCRIVLKNSSKYTVKAFVDPVTGESDFVKGFFNAFEPLDTTESGSLFKSKSDKFFKDVYSADSLDREFAVDYIHSITFKAADKDALITLAQNIPAKIEEPKILKQRVYVRLCDIPQTDVIEFLKKEYRKAGDTADYQFSILRSLGYMRTQESYNALKELILEETPLDHKGSIYTSFFNSIDDSLSLSATLFPELYDLLVLDEYKSNTYSLLAELVDSNKIKLDLVKPRLSQILTEAKNDLKRTLANVENTGYNTGQLDDFSKLLLPFYDEPQVKAHFDKMLNSDNKYLKVSTIGIMLSRGKAVDQKYIDELAKDDEQRTDLYAVLKGAKKENLFPKSEKAPDKIAISLAKSAYSSGYYSTEKDTFIFVDKYELNWKGEPSLVYFYKYKGIKEEGKDYSWAIVGPVPLDDKKIPTYSLFRSNNYEYVDEEDDLKKQLSDMLFEQIMENRKNYYMNSALVDTDDEEYEQLYNNDYD